MRHVLLVLTKSLDPLNDIVTSVERTLPDHRVTVADLTVDTPDYPALLDAIFAADSVQVW
jgi:hypothetical protein